MISIRFCNLQFVPDVGIHFIPFPVDLANFAGYKKIVFN